MTTDKGSGNVVGLTAGRSHIGIAIEQVEHLQTELEVLKTRLLQRADKKEGPLHTATSVQHLVDARRQRAAIFGENLFSDPAWDILLQLYVAELAQLKISTRALCEAADVPLTTAIRWLDKLEDSELIVRKPDRLDARRVHVHLSAKGLASLNNYFSAVGSTVNV